MNTLTTMASSGSDRSTIEGKGCFSILYWLSRNPEAVRNLEDTIPPHPIAPYVQGRDRESFPFIPWLCAGFCWVKKGNLWLPPRLPLIPVSMQGPEKGKWVSLGSPCFSCSLTSYRVIQGMKAAPPPYALLWAVTK